MKLRRQKEGVPGLNTTSTADISFMLLVFFLVTTSMYVDKGLQRRLPPKDKQKQKEITIDKSNMLSLNLDARGNITINDSVVKMDEVKSHAMDFIIKCGKEHVIVIDADDNCPYDTYFHIQNALTDAYRDVRNQMARTQYGRDFEALTSIDREALLNEYPQRVSENLHTKEYSAQGRRTE